MAESLNNRLVTEPELAADQGRPSSWRDSLRVPSLPESHRSISITPNSSWFRKMLAFAGPGYLIAVGYMDPGNWATDIGGGSKFGYALLSVVLISNVMAMFLQALSAKLGVVTGRDLAQACRDHYSPRVTFMLWVVCELAIAACDLAEVLGSAVALKLLFGIPLLAGVLLTALDVLVVLALQGRGFRLVEAFVVTLIATIAACFAYEIFFARPLWLEAAHGFIPQLEILRNKEMLYIAIGILGATVMPHNLYLHSSIVQTRAFGLSNPERREALKFAVIDSTVALGFALFINAAILVLGAAAFHTRGMNEVADISQAYKLLTPVLGASFASTLFAFALLASGQNSTLTGTSGRTNRHGRFPADSAEAVDSPDGHSHHRHSSRGTRHRLRRRRKSYLAAHSQPGGSQLSVAFRRHPSRPVHQRARQDGRVCEFPRHHHHCLARRRDHPVLQCRATLAYLPGIS